MSQTCTICRHKKRTDIEIEIVRGTPYRTIADRYRVSKTALLRHGQIHLPSRLARAEGAEDVAQAGTVLQQVEGLRESALSILAAAEGSEDYETALRAIGEARKCVELLARVAGQLADGPQVNILVSAEWTEVQAIIVGALGKHPEARTSVAAALKILEAPYADAA